MSNGNRRLQELSGVDGRDIPPEILDSERPLLLKGLVADWPLVAAARESVDAADRYLRKFYNGTPVVSSVGPPGIHGRIFYNEDLSGFNFIMQRTTLDAFLDELKRHRDNESPPVHYIGSTTVDYILPGLRECNDLTLPVENLLVSMWLGNQTRIAAHYDVPNNIACVVAGRRRFTLFPPDQLENLYVGPLDHAPAGQAISLVDMHNPDFKIYPKFGEALRHAEVVELEPGDALYIPGLWWHHVEGLESFNALINYWWRGSPAWMGNPQDVLEHALLAIRDLPAGQRKAWRNIFEHYVFAPGDGVTAHIPEQRRGVLAPIDQTMARKLRAQLLKKLNR
jgi:hypothetical protein